MSRGRSSGVAGQNAAEGASASLRIWLLGAFRVEVEGHTIVDSAWRLRKAKQLKVDHPKPETKLTRPGLVLMRPVTRNGDLIVEF